MTTNYLIHLEFKFHNVVAWLYWNFFKAHNSFGHGIHYCTGPTFFEIGIYTTINTGMVIAK